MFTNINDEQLDSDSAMIIERCSPFVNAKFTHHFKIICIVTCAKAMQILCVVISNSYPYNGHIWLSSYGQYGWLTNHMTVTVVASQIACRYGRRHLYYGPNSWQSAALVFTIGFAGSNYIIFKPLCEICHYLSWSYQCYCTGGVHY